MNRMRRMGRAAMAAGLLALLVAATACHRAPSRSMVERRPATSGVPTRLEIANASLQGDIALLKADARRANGALEAQVELQNLAGKARNFEYMFRWVDAKGAEVRDPKAHWTPAQILGGDTFQAQEKAPTAEAADFKMIIRPAATVAR